MSNDAALDFLRSEIRRMLLEFLPQMEASDNADVLTDAVEMWLSVFAAVKAESLVGKTPEEKAGAFALFIRGLVPVTNVGTVRVASKLRRDYGAVAVEFALEDYAPRTKAGIEAGFERTLKTVMSIHDRYAAEHLPREQKPAALPERSNEPARDTIVMDCERLSVKVDDGKVFVRAHGGRFSKFGVPVYPEVLKSIGLSNDDIPIKGYDMTGKSMHIRMNGDKPVKVERFE